MNYINKSENINVELVIIFDLINNVENYDKFLPWCTDSNILSDDAGAEQNTIVESGSIV